MANELDEVTGPVREEGRDVHVIDKQVEVKTTWRSTVFQVALWVLGIIPGLIFAVMKIKARSYLQGLQQKIQHDASEIDNYQVQRVAILQNLAKLLDKAIDLDKSTFVEIAKARGGIASGDAADLDSTMTKIDREIKIAFENYPELKAHQEIAKAIQQNSYLQQEVTAARSRYNDTVFVWNRVIFEGPTKMIVAAKAHYTTRIPFTASAAVKQQSDYGTFF